MSITSSNGSPASAATRSASVSPTRRSMTMYGLPSSSVPEVDHAADVGVPNGPRGPGFLLEAADRVLLRRLRRVEHLDGDRAAQGDVLRLEDRAHSPLAQDAAHAVPAPDGLAEQVAGHGPPRRAAAQTSRAGGLRRRRCRELLRRIAFPVSGQKSCSTAWGRPQWGQRMKRWIIVASPLRAYA